MRPLKPKTVKTKSTNNELENDIAAHFQHLQRQESGYQTSRKRKT